MKVCFLNDSFPPLTDGVINTVINYADIVSEKYGDAMILTPYYPGRDVSHYPYPVVQCASFRVGWIKNYRFGNLLSCRALKKAIDFQPDIIHCHSPVASLVQSVRLRRKTHAPVIFTYHTKCDVEIKQIITIPFLHRPAKKLMVFAINKCDDVWCVSEGAAENLRSMGYKGKVTIIRNGVEFPKGPVNDDEIEMIRREYQLKKDIPTFLFVGRMFWYKGIECILSALHQLKNDGNEFRMIFVGDGEEFFAIKARAEELGIADKCIFTGVVSDRNKLRSIYSAADLFLLPSDYDNAPITVLEALACGCPSVLLRGSSSAEIFEDGKTAFFIENSANSLFLKLKEVAYNPELLKEVGNNAMNDLWFPWEAAVKIAVERYQKILSI